MVVAAAPPKKAAIPAGLRTCGGQEKRMLRRSAISALSTAAFVVAALAPTTGGAATVVTPIHPTVSIVPGKPAGVANWLPPPAPSPPAPTRGGGPVYHNIESSGAARADGVKPAFRAPTLYPAPTPKPGGNRPIGYR
jgi:hypothetical protein